MQFHVIVKVSGNTESIPVMVLENHMFPKPFTYIDGEWVAKYSNFSVVTDAKLDYKILAAGIPSQECIVKVVVKNSTEEKTKESKDTFDAKGWAIITDNLQTPK
ncbi:MAG: hypothetical protein IT245_07675 [Bacteroidia bacterium]|nr:hypothetical protein [Bacteroidia bacterium]